MFGNVHTAMMHDNLSESSNVGDTIRLAKNIHKAIQYKVKTLAINVHEAIEYNVHSATMHDNLQSKFKHRSYDTVSEQHP